MKTYKASVNSQKEYAVTQKDFDMARLDNPNLFQNGRYYGVCPYCNSPVKLIGLTHEIKVSPYAQHTEGDVASVAKKTRKSIYCPANSHKRNADPEERLCAEDEDTFVIKDFLIKQFDVITKIVNHYSDIYYSFDQKIELFKNAYRNNIWQFPLIDTSNIPWILLYCKQAEEIKCKLIKNDSELYSFLKAKKVNLKPSTHIKNYSFIEKKDYGIVENMCYSFTFHNRFIDDNDEYKETICAVLTRSNHFNNPPEDGYTEFFRNKITINHQELPNKIDYYNEHNLRDKKLIEAINKVIED